MKLTGERPIEGKTPDSLLALHAAGYREVRDRMGEGRFLDLGCGLGDGTVTFAAGATTATTGVQIKTDAIDEPDEQFTLVLGTATNLTKANSSATGTIGMAITRAGVRVSAPVDPPSGGADPQPPTSRVPSTMTARRRITFGCSRTRVTAQGNSDWRPAVSG